MNKAHISIYVLVIFAMSSCKSELTPEQQHINALHSRIMEVHDEMMPKMKDIYKLKKSLKSSDIQNGSALISELDEADEAMMSWMSQYKKPSSKRPDYEKYLDEQWQSVQEMKEVMNTAILTAKQALQ